MPGSSPAEAVRAFVDPLQRVAATITDVPFVLSPGGRSLGGAHSVLLGSGDPVPLKAGTQKYHLFAQLGYEIIRNDRSQHRSDRYRVRTTSYRYHLLTADLTEILLWHWHPKSRSPVDGPHLHVGASQLSDAGVAGIMQHIPTGRTAFEEVVLHLIQQHRVKVRTRTEAEAVELALAGLQDFQRWRRWSSVPVRSGPLDHPGPRD